MLTLKLYFVFSLIHLGKGVERRGKEETEKRVNNEYIPNCCKVLEGSLDYLCLHPNTYYCVWHKNIC